LLVAGVGAAAMMRPRTADQPQQASTASVPAKPIGVGGRGRIEPQDGIIFVAAPYFNGRPSIMTAIRVKEGDLVRAGQILGEVEGRIGFEKVLRQREAGVEVARMRLAQVKAGPKQADIDEQKVEIARWESELEIALNDLRRYEKLRETEDVSVAEVDQKRLIVERDRRMIDAAKERLKSLEAIRSEDVEVLSAQLAAAMADVDQARVDLDRVYVRAPVTARVLRVHALPGEEVVPPGVLELGKMDRMYVIADVYETDITRVRIGQKAKITGELLPGELTGTVELIDAQVSKSDLLPLEPTAFADTRVVKVKIVLEPGEGVARYIYGKVDVVFEP
jgi:HlyD family secretion protein